MSLFCFNSCNPSSSLTYVRATQNTEESRPLSTALKALHPVLLSPLFEHSLLTHPLAPVNPSSQGLGVCRSFWNIFPAPSSPAVSQPSSRSGLKGRLLRGALQNGPPPPFPRFGPFPFFISLLSSYYSLERCWPIARGLVTVSQRGCGPRREASGSGPPRSGTPRCSRTTAWPCRRLRPARAPAAPQPRRLPCLPSGSVGGSAAAVLHFRGGAGGRGGALSPGLSGARRRQWRQRRQRGAGTGPGAAP